MQKPGRSQETIVALGPGPDSASRGTGNTAFGLFCRTKTPKQTEDVNKLMKHSSFQGAGHSLITPRTTEAHQEDHLRPDFKSTGPEHSLEELMLKPKLQYFGHLM